MHLRTVGLLCLLLLILSTGASAKIVFSSNREGVEGVYVMDDDGSNQTLLTESEMSRPFPNCWHPDGKQIAFKRLAEVSFAYVVFLMNADGTNIRQVTEDDDSIIGRVSFSPDGTSIVFDREVRRNNQLKYGIYVLDIETGKMEEIAEQLMASNCDWSPDGKHIIFSEWISGAGGVNTIWIMGAGGQNPRRLIQTPAGGQFLITRTKPRWSPDGKQIVFLQREYTWEVVPNIGNVLIYHAHRYMICDRNGKNVKKLQIPKEWNGLGIDWMDDGKSVVFSAYVGLPLGARPPPFEEFPPCNIYKFHIETGDITRLTDHPGRDESLDWISDKAAKAFAVTPQGKKKVQWGTLKK